MKKRTFLEKYNGLKLEWLHDSLHFIMLVVFTFILFRYVIGISIVGGDSMNPTLKDGSIVVYLRMVNQYKPGDVISMRVPSGEYYVKRVVAEGNDVVAVKEGSVFVNGEKVNESWAHGSTERETGAVIYPYTVREGNVFVLGDNREVSMDSRAFGEVSYRQIRGKIFLQLTDGKFSFLE